MIGAGPLSGLAPFFLLAASNAISEIDLAD
jgi:hypothetical protein